MKKLLVLVFAFALLTAGVASAQTYSYGGCFTPTVGLSYGSRGSDVSALQQFLVNQNYPGSGAWMVTGYFGSATQAALRTFQSQRGLPQTGSVDGATASAISQVACGGAGSYPYTTYPGYGYTGYGYNPYPSGYPSSFYYYGQTPTITSLSQNTGMPGTQVTVYGVGFDPYGNTVTIGGVSLYNIPAANGTSLTFTVPSNLYGSYSSGYGSTVQITVSNSRGTSNSVSFTIYSGYPFGYGYGYQYTNNNCGGYNPYSPYNYSYGYTYCYPYQQSQTPVISYLNPTSGAVGSTVTIYGAGFSTSGNSVRFGPGVIANLSSYDGHSLSFTVPAYLTGFGSQPVTLSTYQVSVVNQAGVVSNAVPFTVTSLGGNTSGGQPVISQVTGPNSLYLGQQGTWSFVVNAPTNQYLTVSVNWGDQAYFGAQPLSQNQYYTNQTVMLTHTYYQRGTYTIQFTVSTQYGGTNTYTTTVVVQ